MSERISVSKSELDEVYRKLKKDQGLSLNEISQEIDAHFKNHLYAGINMEVDAFLRLKDLYGDEIDHKVVDHRNGVAYEKRIGHLEKNAELAEFIGMLLGDGHIKNLHYVKENGKHVTNYRVKFTFHEDEEEVIDRARTLFENCTNRTPKTMERKDSRAMTVSLYSKDLVDLLVEVGLKAGNKTKNQVGVPNWIKQDLRFQKKCVKGLVDTDGTIYERSHDGYRVVQFKNASKPLLEDFEEMCTNLGIRCSMGGYRTVQVAAQEEVEKFIDIIDPIKAKKL